MRNAFVRAEHVVNWSNKTTPISSSDTGLILECCGCNRVYFRRDYWFSEWDNYGENAYTGEPEIEYGIQTTYFPAETTRNPPIWLSEIRGSDNTLGLLLDELYSALNSDLRVLAAIGARTAFDRSSELLGVNSALQFNEKLDELVTLGKIGKDERVTLADIRQIAASSGPICSGFALPASRTRSPSGRPLVGDRRPGAPKPRRPRAKPNRP